MESFMKFPSTPHLAVLDGAPIRDDKVFSDVERELFLSNEVTVEEKIDGANLGISFCSDGVLRAQNRGSVLAEPMTGQWKKLPDWLAERRESFFDVLTDQYILFGEWCYATHSVFYDSLPDWFIGFDVFDLYANRFLCKRRRNVFLGSLKLHSVPCIATGRFSLAEINGMIGRSRFGNEMAEGLYLRSDDDNWLNQRAKLVRPAFIQSIDTHWSRGLLKVNRLAECKGSH